MAEVEIHFRSLRKYNFHASFRQIIALFTARCIPIGSQCFFRITQFLMQRLSLQASGLKPRKHYTSSMHVDRSFVLYTQRTRLG